VERQALRWSPFLRVSRPALYARRPMPEHGGQAVQWSLACQIHADWESLRGPRPRAGGRMSVQPGSSAPARRAQARLTRRPVTFASACAGRSIPLTPRPVWGCRETASRGGSYQARTAAATPYGRSGPPRHCIRSSLRRDRHRTAFSISCTLL
jgi:hypothetical protein